MLLSQADAMDSRTQFVPRERCNNKMSRGNNNNDKSQFRRTGFHKVMNFKTINYKLLLVKSKITSCSKKTIEDFIKLHYSKYSFQSFPENIAASAFRRLSRPRKTFPPALFQRFICEGTSS